MQRILLSIGAVVCVSAIVIQTVYSRAEPSSRQSATDRGAPSSHSADEAIIRANVEAFAKAYNAGDPKAIAALFTTDGQILDKEGNATQGREAITRTFDELFKSMPQKKIEVAINSVRFVSSDLAVEVGTTKETPLPTEPPSYDRYTALHVKRDGKWLMALARDEEGPAATPHERLQPLAWLVGEWVDDGGSTVVHSTCRWSEDGNYLLQEFSVKRSGREAMGINQRIGWDPQSKQIRSWVFDSRGGFAEGRWARDEDGWIIRAAGVSCDSVPASSTDFLIPTGRDGYTWRSTDRVMGENRQPPVEVRVVRRPPEPKR